MGIGDESLTFKHRSNDEDDTTYLYHSYHLASLGGHCVLRDLTNISSSTRRTLPNNSFWRDYDSDGGRNLKTQKGFIQCVRENIQYKVINDVPFELLSFANPLDYAILDIRLDLVLNVRKRDLSPTALHAIALETINTRFPPEKWLHIYTDGSLLDFAQGAGIGVFSHLFSFYEHAGPLTTHFDVTSPICVLYDNGQDMTAAHLDECSALNDLNCIVKGIGEPVA
ncbi:RNase H domain-containing protein [Trichonephila clavipes]|uniref:RNase H domain-containing protein n=1 Tax=Trichonephila clavipes TaxID=2585209 RepID=A0A8X6URH9_TRICX|nr:RNase H domain-containing protein [Trichonephila clavipes]